MQSEISVIEASWDGLNIKYVHSGERLNSLENKSLIMRIAILNQELNSVYPEQENSLPECLQITISPLLFEKIVDQQVFSANKVSFHQAEITDASLLHLAYLLCDEIETPKLLNKHFVSPLVTILITHCLGAKFFEQKNNTIR
jgi:hypothetical protein